MVERDDVLNGAHVDVYAYDPVSGRLASVQDALTGEVHRFVWNPEGTLARWEQVGSYARVFGYDEEGRLVKIEREYGSGGVQLAYEYGYNSDGVRVWKRDVRNGQEYRYVCGIGCGGVPMQVYDRPTSGGSWTSLEDYLPAGNALQPCICAVVSLSRTAACEQQTASARNVVYSALGGRPFRGGAAVNAIHHAQASCAAAGD